MTSESERMIMPSLSRELPKRLDRSVERETESEEGRDSLEGLQMSGEAERIGEWPSTEGVDGVI
jgi:hypothetical protein